MKLKLEEYLKDDKGNKSITRLGFFIILVLIFIMSIYVVFYPSINKIYLLSLLIGFDLSLVGIKNWKDIIQKKF